MQYNESDIPRLDPADVKAMLHEAESQIRPSLGKTLAVLSLGLLCLSPLLWINWLPWWALLVFLPILGLGSLIAMVGLHECAHFSLFASRRVNTLVGVFLGLLTLTPFGSYRRGHFAHHRWLGTAKDPTPAPKGPVPPQRLLDLLLWIRVLPVFFWAGVYGPYLIYDLFPTAHPRKAVHVWQWLGNILLILGCHGVLSWYLGGWYYWLGVGLAFLAGSILYEHLFTMHQHVGLQAVPVGQSVYTRLEQVNFSRTVASVVPDLLFAFHLHKEHHLAPWLHHQHLPYLHQLLEAKYPEVYAFTTDDVGLLRRRQQRAHELLTPTIGEPR